MLFKTQRVHAHARAIYSLVLRLTARHPFNQTTLTVLAVHRTQQYLQNVKICTAKKNGVKTKI